MTEQKATNITWHHSMVTREDREKLLKQKGVVIWFTGLSASGKSTIAHTVEEKLYDRGILTYVLDGDNIRHGLNKNLGFSPEDREENIRRIGEVGKLFADAGIITMTAFISPYRADRDKARKLHEPGRFIEVFVDAPLSVLEERDPKGLYKKARAGQIPEFTGISAPYEPPEHPELHLDTSKMTVEECANVVIQYLEEKEIIPS
ncbi:MAG: adenylyl-sulfate kinase [candidate division KSB1 bacterium]|nr:adenylyl-sulfate kinase [candidate division KSB1 bacterium]MDZ7336776.1 adenylyl-sulfate kinase [candidate division KSB1 bacterium]MDZ7358553.1 adenylyl-sulfate kinase [candidate division KSB1 bacterium]MDZ7401643.1 adenylyl-sulfate kinase [candidate division KSB1 bacterium]